MLICRTRRRGTPARMTVCREGTSLNFNLNLHTFRRSHNAFGNSQNLVGMIGSKDVLFHRANYCE